MAVFLGTPIDKYLDKNQTFLTCLAHLAIQVENAPAVQALVEKLPEREVMLLLEMPTMSDYVRKWLTDCTPRLEK